MKNQKKIHVGIDPDLHKSGFAVVQNGKYQIIDSLPMWELFEKIIQLNPDKIHLEFSTNKGTWHAGGAGASIRVGKNQAVAIIIKEFCEAKGFELNLINPTRWTRFSQTFNDKEFFKKQTGWTGRTNKDARAAAAILWGIK